MIFIFFRTDDDKVKNNKKEKKSNDTLEDRYENSISKIVEIEGTKKVRMLLPIKTQNGIIEKRIIQENHAEDNGNISEEHMETSHEEHNIEKSNMEIKFNFHVRFH